MGKRSHRKPRTETITATTTGEVTQISLTQDTKTGEIWFETPVTNVRHEVSYDRAKAPKILSSTPLNEPKYNFEPNRALVRNYDALVAIDTNTQVLFGLRISVTAIVLCRLFSSSETKQAVSFWVPFCIEFTNTSVSAEKLGWVEALREIFQRKLMPPDARIGVVVDAHLGEIPSINERKQPILDNLLLPSHLTLIYASADAGKENIVNNMLSLADKTATQVMLKLAEGEAAQGRRLIPGRHYQSRRILHGKKVN